MFFKTFHMILSDFHVFSIQFNVFSTLSWTWLTLNLFSVACNSNSWSLLSASVSAKLVAEVDFFNLCFRVIVVSRLTRFSGIFRFLPACFSSAAGGAGVLILLLFIMEKSSMKGFQYCAGQRVGKTLRYASLVDTCKMRRNWIMKNNAILLLLHHVMMTLLLWIK